MQIANARVLGPPLRLVDVDADDAPMVEQVAERCEVGRAASVAGASLDDQVWADFVQQLLVDPEVEGTLEERCAQPVCVQPGARAHSVVEAVEVTRDETRNEGVANDARTDLSA